MIPSELREQLVRFSDGDISVQEFERWFVPRLPSLVASRDRVDLEVVGAIELGLAEYGSGVRSAAELKLTVSTLLSSHWSVWAVYPTGSGMARTSTSSSGMSTATYAADSVEASWAPA